MISWSIIELETYTFSLQSNTSLSFLYPSSCSSTAPLTSSSINSSASSTFFQNSSSWIITFLNYSPFSSVWSALSFFSWVWSGLWDNASIFFWELPGLYISWKSYSCNSVIQRACWRLSFCGFLKYPKLLWSVHILNWLLPIRYCYHCLSPFIIANNSWSYIS